MRGLSVGRCLALCGFGRLVLHVSAPLAENDAVRRQDLVQADLRCVLCDRLIGQFVGLVWHAPGARRTPTSPLKLNAFRPADPRAPVVRLTGREQFRCGHCGGYGLVEDIVVSVAREWLPHDVCPIHVRGERRRGRPPKGCRCLGSRAA
jgi:hypothetical protein